MPVVFLSHGSPTLPFDEIPARSFMVGLGAKLPRPKAILCISAHWEADVASLTGAAAPGDVHARLERSGARDHAPYLSG